MVVSHAGRNVGDNLLAEILADRLRVRWPNSVISSFTVNPIRLHVPGLVSLFPLRRGFAHSIWTFYRECRRADQLVGFWAIQDRGSWRYAVFNLLPRAICFVALPRMVGLRLTFINVDAAELGTRAGRLIAKFSLRHVERLVVRNEASASVVRELGREANAITCDIGVLYRPATAREQRTRRVLINLRPVELNGSAKLGLRRALNRLVEWAGADQIEILAMRDNDVGAAEDLIETLGLDASRIHQPETATAASQLIQSAHCVVAMRLHAQILSMVCGTPVFTIAYHEKNVHVAQAAEMGTWCVPAEDTDALNERVQAFTDAIDRKTFPLPKLECAIQKARSTFDYVDICLSSGHAT